MPGLVINAGLSGNVNLLVAGTTTTPPLQFTSGVNNTTPVSGAEEFDGTDLYFTAAASSRQIVDCEQFQSLTSNFTLSNVNTAQQALNGTASGALSVQATTSYAIEGLYMISNTGTTSHTWGILFGGTATITAGPTFLSVLAYTSASGNVITPFSGIFITGAGISAVTAVTAASTSATESVQIRYRGRIAINAAGTLIPQLQLSAATGTAATMLAGSYVRMWPIGAGAVVSVGNWS